MNIRRLFSRHNGTAYVHVDTRRCEACGLCVAACPRGVLHVAGLLFHRHVHVGRAGECEGCYACVEACPHGVIQPRPQSEGYDVGEVGAA